MLLSMSHTMETFRGIVRTGQIVDDRSHHRSKRVANDDHAQPVIQGGAKHTFFKEGSIIDGP
jgi:hypothetical protein